MSSFYPKAFKLEDSARHGATSGAELFIVEGDSAARAVAVLRQAEFQAALPMQGKPLNALKAGAPRVRANDLYQRLSQALGVPMEDARLPGKAIPCDSASSLEALRFQRILLLFDPDADGIHIGALMLMFFWRWMRPLLASGRIEMVRAPSHCLQWVDGETGEVLSGHAYSEQHLQAQCHALRLGHAREIRSHAFRGLGGIDQPLLRSLCIAPQTRHTEVLGMADAEAAISVFARPPG